MKFMELEFLTQAVKDPKLLKQDKDWLAHAKPYLAAIEPCRDVDKFFDNFSKYKFATLEDGRTCSMEQIKLIWQLVSKVSRSDIVSSNFTKVPQYSSAVPLPMSAMKDRYGIKYSEWEFNDSKWSNLLLGKGLENIFEITKFLQSLEIDVFDPKLQQEWKDIATEGIPATSYGPKLKPVFEKGHPIRSKGIMPFYWHMITQTWIFDSSIRHVDMITNLLDWDTPSEELHVSVMLPVNNTQAFDDMPW